MTDRGLYGRACYWRATMQPARMFVWDARLAPAVLLTMLHFRLWTVLLTAAVLAAALLLQRRGISVPAGLRLARSLLAGRHRPATSRPPRRAASWIDECEGGGRWDPATCRPIPPPRWLRSGAARLDRMAGLSGPPKRRGRKGSAHPRN